MLEKALAAIKADKAKALETMQKGEGGFKDRDLYVFYVFCANASDGIFTVHPALRGQSMRGLKDKTGKELGDEMMKVSSEGKFEEVGHMWPRPGADTTPVQRSVSSPRLATKFAASATTSS